MMNQNHQKIIYLPTGYVFSLPYINRIHTYFGNKYLYLIMIMIMKKILRLKQMEKQNQAKLNFASSAKKESTNREK